MGVSHLLQEYHLLFRWAVEAAPPQASKIKEEAKGLPARDELMILICHICKTEGYQRPGGARKSFWAIPSLQLVSFESWKSQ